MKLKNTSSMGTKEHERMFKSFAQLSHVYPKFEQHLSFSGNTPTTEENVKEKMLIGGRICCRKITAGHKNQFVEDTQN